jgi:ElaB/YqjD/DUF883 family membrane-anchored ribosome-binding protein
MSEETNNDTLVEEIAESVSETVEEVVDTVEDLAKDIAQDIKTKIKGMPETDENNVIGSSRTTAKGGKKTGAIGVTNNDAIGSVRVDRQAKAKPEPKPLVTEETVAVFSTRNVSWEGVGSVKKGYNIVKPDIADKWLTRSHVRLATPEEVAEEYGI